MTDDNKKKGNVNLNQPCDDNKPPTMTLSQSILYLATSIKRRQEKREADQRAGFSQVEKKSKEVKKKNRQRLLKMQRQLDLANRRLRDEKKKVYQFKKSLFVIRLGRCNFLYPC
jgi:hypothetical protein